MSNLPASRLVTDIYAHTSSFFFTVQLNFYILKHMCSLSNMSNMSLCRAVECLITDTVIAQWTVACLNPSSSVSSYSHLNFLYFLPLSLFLISSFPPSFPLTSPLLFCSLAVSGERLSICVCEPVCVCAKWSACVCFVGAFSPCDPGGDQTGAR